MMKRIQLLLLSLLLALPMTVMAQNTLKGDVNGDGVVNISDLNAIIDMIIDSSRITDAADVNGDGVVNISDLNAIISIIIDGPSLPDEEDDYVDLGLPSGTLWATRNVGASKPEDYGDYFAWGETTPKEEYWWDTYKWCDGTEDILTKYNTRNGMGTVDNKTELEPEDDAAFVNCGASWRMPSPEQLKELCDSCTWVWTTRNGVNGYRVTGSNGNSLFLPATGERLSESLGNDGTFGNYWSCMLPNFPIDPGYALGLQFNLNFRSNKVNYIRCMGMTVRPVRLPIYIEQNSLDLGEVLVEQTCTGELTIVNNTIDSVTLTATADAPFLFLLPQDSVSTMTITVPGKSRETVTVMFTATTPGDFNGNVTFQGSALYGGQCVIPIHALAYITLYDFVDLGLPSGTLWAMCNVGASSPREFGDYFAWGETSPKTDYDWSTYKWCDGSSDKLMKYCTDSRFGTVDDKTELEPEDDAAYVNWGALWRMPTLEQMQELCDSNICKWVWDENGFQVMGPNGNSLFLPAAGYRNDNDSSPIFVDSYGDYWSRTLNANHPDYARDQYFFSSGAHYGISSRNLGFTVRPVLLSADVYIVQKKLDLGGVLMGDTLAGDTLMGKLTIVNNTTEPITLNAAADEPFSFKLEDGSTSTMTIEVPATSRDTMTVMFTATTLGDFSGNVTFRSSALPGGESVIPVYARVYTDDIPEHEYVDLGLPSGTLWATCNVGADNPEDYGDYFAWGEIEAKEDYSWETYKWCNSSDSTQTMTKYCTDAGSGEVDNKTELDPEDDVAYVNWGPEWRMPTSEQQQELKDECNWTWTTRNDVNGLLITGPNGNSLFLPANGYHKDDSLNLTGSNVCCWSRTLYSSAPYYAFCAALNVVDSVFVSYDISNSRAIGFAVRPVRVSGN